MEHIFLASKVVGKENRKFDSGNTTHADKIVISKSNSLVWMTLLSETWLSQYQLISCSFPFIKKIVAGVQPNQL
jgi:hypothetical protein